MSAGIGFSPAVLAGRDAELAHLTAVLSGVLAGRPHAVVISGVVGIGKTRLAMEALGLARARGLVTLAAEAAPLEQDLSYAPIVRALRPLLDVDADRRAALVSGLPDLGWLFDDLELPESVSDLGDPGLLRTRLFEAVRQFLQRATAAHPIALLVDDVHWLDNASQALLGYLARCLTDSRLLILLTYRDDEPDERAGGAGPLLGTLRWAAGAPDNRRAVAALRLSELTLSTLDEEDLATLTADLLGGEPPAGLIRLLADRSAGVPLFAQALIATLATTGSLTRVSGRWVLRPAATDLAPDPVRALLEQRVNMLRGAGALVEPAHAVEVLVDAVVVALRRRAGDEAVAFAQAALDLMTDHRLPGNRAALLTSLAEGAQLVCRLAQALAATLDAAAIGYPLARAHRLGTAAGIAWDLGSFDPAEQCLRDADHLIDGLPAGPIHVFIGEVGVRQAAHGDRRDQRDARLHRLADLAERTGLVRARAVLELAHLTEDLADGQVRGALHRVDGLLALCRRLADPLFTECALRSVTLALLSHGDLAGAADSAQEGIALAGQIGSPALGATHRSHLSVVRILQGRLSDAVTLSGQLIELGERLGMARVTAMGTTLAALAACRQGRLAEAESLIDEVRERFGHRADSDRYLSGFVDLVRAFLRLDRGDMSGAVEIAGAVRAWPTAVRVFAFNLQARGLIGDGRLAEARGTIDQLRLQSSGKDLMAALVERLDAHLLAAEGDHEGAARLFAAAADGFDRIGMAVDAAEARLDAISRLPVAGAPPEWIGPRPLRETLEQAVEVLAACGVEPGVNRGRRLLRGYGRTTGSSRARRTGAAELSPREEEVVRLVAAGLSNPAIAERLWISRRTVTTHLQKVYARLGIRSRAMMTRWVMEHLET